MENFLEINNIKKWKKDPIFNTEMMLPISEIQENTIILKDWWLRAIISVAGINIDLKNWEEIEVIIERYKKFLNWLEFPIQILVRNNYLDISKYIKNTKTKLETINIYQIQDVASKYINFMEQINLKQSGIYNKEFYIIVPYHGNMWWEVDQIKKPWWQKFMNSINLKFGAEQIVAKYRWYLKNRSKLDIRCGVVLSWLSSIGIESQRLDFNQIVNLLFNCYNPNLLNSK